MPFNNALYDNELSIYFHPDDLVDKPSIQRFVTAILRFGDRMNRDFGVFPDILEFKGKLALQLYNTIIEAKRYNFGEIKVSAIDYFENTVTWKYSKNVKIQYTEGGMEHEKPIRDLVVPGWVTTTPFDNSMSFEYTMEKQERPEIRIVLINPDDIINTI